MQKIYISIANILLFAKSLYAETISRTDLTDAVQTIIPNASPNSGSINYVSIAKEVQYWIFALVGVIAVIYIIWIGAKLIWAPGNTEEVSKAMKSLGYIIIGLAIMPFAYFIVSFIINFSI